MFASYVQPFFNGVCRGVGSRTTIIHFVEPDVKVNAGYCGEDLMKKHSPDISQLKEFDVFQQDSAIAHWARETVDLLTRETPDFTLHTSTTKQLKLNALDYNVSSVLQKVYKVLSRTSTNIVFFNFGSF